ncbi:carboxypeptidase M32 [Anaeromyxobacter oryzae]|uniref:Metal-dependent carboxypeptidase n=1 Tax=Anaeromyxobacter oryzae TaxID=2918170 RepID=A0ABN6MV24_9BACT|nr:carboxypeptidase M32 [Anaeromyxobacter oryzae]BDG03659.1 carboxypeptidase M32 [Anaeromyxobacter oryzae]
MPETAWETLSRAMAEIRALSGASALLQWDQETYMPPKGSGARGDQLAAIQGAQHERLTAPPVAEALARAEAERTADPDRAAALRVLRFDHDRAARIPGDLVRAIAQAQAAGVDAWKAARDTGDFGRFAPALERLLALRREQASAYGAPAGGEPYDALLEGYEPGMRVARLEPLFARLVSWLVPLVEKVTARPPPDDAFLRGRFDPEQQWQFTLELLDAVGFDREAGRQDRSIHPFSLGLDPGDVRVTTRIFEDLPLSAIFSTLHEAGHGLYEQHLPAELRRSVLCAAPSMGLHESQSRLWENLVGRSLPFWRAFLPRLARRFPALEGVSPEVFFRAVNRVERSLVRVEADEVTYNLHIVLRFELELALLRGKLAVKDLPEAWDARSERLLGVRPAAARDGVLQDIHWAWGELGYFPTYTLGNLYAASLFAAARRGVPGLDDELGKGNLRPLLGWLAEHVHRIGRRKEAEDIVRDATGNGLGDRDFEAYLTEKYGA